MLGLYWDNGKENGNYFAGSRVSGIDFRNKEKGANLPRSKYSIFGHNRYYDL